MPTIIVCSFPVLMTEIREKLKKSAKDQAWTKFSENLHKLALAQFAVLPTDAFKLQRRLALCWYRKHSSMQQLREFTFYCKQGCKLPIIYTWEAKTSFCLSSPVRTTTKTRVCRLPKIGNFVSTNFSFLQPCSHLRHVKLSFSYNQKERFVVMFAK